MEVIEIHDPKNWSPSWLDSQPIEETPPFVPSQTCDTELDDEEMKGQEVVESDDWVWAHDGQRWWVGCPPMMTREEAMSSWAPTDGEADGTDKPQVTDNVANEPHDKGAEKKDEVADTKAEKNDEVTDTKVEKKDEVTDTKAEKKDDGVTKTSENAKVRTKEVETTPAKRPSPETPGAPEKSPKKQRKLRQRRGTSHGHH